MNIRVKRIEYFWSIAIPFLFPLFPFCSIISNRNQYYQSREQWICSNCCYPRWGNPKFKLLQHLIILISLGCMTFHCSIPKPTSMTWVPLILTWLFFSRERNFEGFFELLQNVQSVITTTMKWVFEFQLKRFNLSSINWVREGN